MRLNLKEREFPLWRSRSAVSWEHWDAGSIPCQAQRVKDPSLLHLGLRSQLWLRCGPWPRNSICCGAAKKKKKIENTFNFVLFCFVLFFTWATPMAYGGSQARGLIRAIAASLHHSHSNTRSKPRL